jgi:small nuclear ribonucleoprotein (snRNP)-like protein
MALAVLSLNGKAQVALRASVSAGGEQDEEKPQLQLEQVPQPGGGAGDVSVGEATREVMALLGALVRVKISDGRVVVGHFHCFDKHQNVIVKDAREYPPLRARAPPAKGKDKTEKSKAEAEQEAADEDAHFAGVAATKRAIGGRTLGMVLVPGKHIVYMKVLPSTVSQTQGRRL